MKRLDRMYRLQGSSDVEMLIPIPKKTIKCTMVYPHTNMFVERNTLDSLLTKSGDYIQNEIYNAYIEHVREMSGKFAGVCYTGDDIWKTIEEDLEVSVSRAEGPFNRGHHSIAEHLWVSVAIENVGKLTMMMLNNEKFYNTSEKSGRWTNVSTTCSEIERSLYNKWQPIFVDLISKMYPDKFTEKEAIKLAQENCRNFCSTFFQSRLVYTASIRQWNYLIDFCERFKQDIILHYGTLNSAPTWLHQLSNELQSLRESLWFLYIPELRENKNRTFSLINPHTCAFDPREQYEYFADAFSTHFKASHPGLGQCIRHKTISYQAFFDEENPEYYVPTILNNNPELIKDWLSDMHSVTHLYPQGLLFNVRVKGTLEMFELIPYERFCGRAQHEIMNIMFSIYQRYLNSPNITLEEKQRLLKYSSGSKCSWTQCKEPCKWGSKCQQRLI